MSAPSHIRRVRALHQRKMRVREGLFLVQGRKMLSELVRSTFEVVEVHCTAEAAAMIGPSGIQVHVHPARDLERMGTFKRGNEVVAVVRIPDPPALQLPGAGRFVLALDRVSDPGNMGTLLRIADWFGATQLWCCAETVEVWNPKCVQASMGSIFRMPVVEVALSEALDGAAKAGVQVYRAEASGANVFHTRLMRPAVLVMGSESHGLSEATRGIPGTSIAIPAYGRAESLNVSTAAAALCMELARQAEQP